MIILVDMDGVIADFEKGIINIYRKRHPQKYFVQLEKRTLFYVKEQYPKELQPLIEEIYLSEGFYLKLPLIKGSLNALEEMLSRGNAVYICTDPLSKNPFCIKEKYDWIRKNLGEHWTKRVIVSEDKTIIHGDFLIDDKPEIKGVRQPSWEHILFSQPYNAHITSKKRITWENWKSVIG